MMRYKIKNNYKKVSVTSEKIKLVIFLLFSFNIANFAAFKDTGWGARPIGMGGAYVAVSDDSNAPLFNPSGIYQVNWYEANFMYAKLFSGLESFNLGLSYVSFILPTKNSGNFGIQWGNFLLSENYKENTISLTYATNLDKILEKISNKAISPEILLGINLKYLAHSYTLDKYSYTDPLFSNGTSKGNITFDIGVLSNHFYGKFSPLSLGLSLKNITQPDLGLKQKDIVPLEARVGAAYDFKNIFGVSWTKNLLTAIDLSYRNQEWGNSEDKLNIHLGCESWFVDEMLAVRVGGNLLDISFGLGFRTPKKIKTDMQFDYAFIWPLHLEQTTGSHRFSLIYRFGHVNKETKILEKSESEKQKINQEDAQRQMQEKMAKELAAKKLEEEKKIESQRKQLEQLKQNLKDTVQIKETEKGLILNLTSSVNFEKGTTKLTTESYQVLDQVVKLLNAYSENKISIEGHSDSSPLSKNLQKIYPSNYDLSKARAQSVADYLVSKGINRNRIISIIGFGPDKPIADNKTPEGRARNRRVEIIILKN